MIGSVPVARGEYRKMPMLELLHIDDAQRLTLPSRSLAGIAAFCLGCRHSSPRTA